MALKLITAPAIEPVTAAEAKLHARVVDSAEDSLITLMIGAARRYAESYTRSAFITQTWKWVGDAFCDVHEFERGPVQSVVSMSWKDMAGATQTLATPTSSNYRLENAGLYARFTPAFGYSWPDTLPEIGAASITYTAGYGDAAADVPDGIRHWILVRVATAYDTREEIELNTNRGQLASLPYFDRLLDPYCAWTC